MGNTVCDPEAVEEGGSIRGLQLLPLKTVLSSEKYRSQTEDCFDDLTGVFSSIAGEEFVGYEIHNGVTTVDDTSSSLEIIERDEEGNIILVQNKNLLGTYVHGVFDQGDLAYRLVSAIAETKGLNLEAEAVDYQQLKEQEYDKLADVIRENLDMKYIYSLLED